MLWAQSTTFCSSSTDGPKRHSTPPGEELVEGGRTLGGQILEELLLFGHVRRLHNQRQAQHLLGTVMADADGRSIQHLCGVWLGGASSSRALRRFGMQSSGKMPAGTGEEGCDGKQTAECCG